MEDTMVSMTQKEALEILKAGHNAFITGPAGSGKTYLLNKYIDFLRKNEIGTAVTASTGIAATHLGGITIHSWSGLGIKNSLSDVEIENLKKRSYLKSRYRRMNVLIIDEISMLHHFQLDLLDRLFRSFKDENLPFGGVQVVFCGDFFQLPPVMRSGGAQKQFAYHSQSWQSLGLKICYLDEQHRQSDNLFLAVLNAIRNNAVSDCERSYLEARIGKAINGKIEPTKLYSHNADVDIENMQELAKIPGREYKFKMEAKGGDNLVEIIKRGCLAPDVLRLKIGARVMFVKNNFEQGYSNGTLGVVKFLDKENIRVQTKTGRMIDVSLANWLIEENGKIKAEISQYPLRLAWAITVHKSQGMSLDAAKIDLSQSFERGMGYVALSRVRSLDGLSLIGFNETALKVSGEVLEFDRELKKESEKHAEGIRITIKENPRKEESGKKLSAKLKSKKKTSTYQQTKELAEKKMPLEDIAKARKMTVGTILGHLEKLKEQGKMPDISHMVEEDDRRRYLGIQRIVAAGKTEDGKYPLSYAKELLGEDASWEELRLARLLINKEF
ncbi:MAG: AAA family ATPase [Candidatus Pacebacteria bacterium]|nr:AAA family ATPase [Candidatus Paceibacterota bacterium]MDD4874947.1 AAA family ATPase [Candidatus Paceibacterota bacterium]